MRSRPVALDPHLRLSGVWPVLQRPGPVLTPYGWTEALAEAFAPFAAEGLVPARVVIQHRARFVLMGAEGEFSAETAGRFLHNTSTTGLPVVGDWVAVAFKSSDSVSTIHAVLPRRSQFVRKAAGVVDKPQVVAANFDVVLLTTGLDTDFNLRRIERYLTAAWGTGAQPVVVLTKADLVENVAERVAQVEAVALGAPVLAVSAPTGLGLDQLRTFLAPGTTAVMLGMSGVGKSTLVNALAGEARQAVGEVRATDGRGRHTTTHRELSFCPVARCCWIRRGCGSWGFGIPVRPMPRPLKTLRPWLANAVSATAAIWPSPAVRCRRPYDRGYWRLNALRAIESSIGKGRLSVARKTQPPRWRTANFGPARPRPSAAAAAPKRKAERPQAAALIPSRWAACATVTMSRPWVCAEAIRRARASGVQPQGEGSGRTSWV